MKNQDSVQQSRDLTEKPADNKRSLCHERTVTTSRMAKYERVKHLELIMDEIRENESKRKKRRKHDKEHSKKKAKH